MFNLHPSISHAAGSGKESISSDGRSFTESTHNDDENFNFNNSSEEVIWSPSHHIEARQTAGFEDIHHPIHCCDMEGVIAILKENSELVAARDNDGLPPLFAVVKAYSAFLFKLRHPEAATVKKFQR